MTHNCDEGAVYSGDQQPADNCGDDSGLWRKTRRHRDAEAQWQRDQENQKPRQDIGAPAF